MFFMSVVDTDSALEKEPHDTNRDKLIEINIRRIQRGNTDAIADIYDATKSSVYGFILSILKNPDDAEDVLQDTYIKICTSAALYESYGKPMAWILTIARNMALMKIRKQSRQVDIPDFAWGELTDDKKVSTEDKIVLEAALKRLTTEESSIVMLHAVSGIKHREIADILDMPLATVLSKYNRALKKLRKILEEENE